MGDRFELCQRKSHPTALVNDDICFFKIILRLVAGTAQNNLITGPVSASSAGRICYGHETYSCVCVHSVTIAELKAIAKGTSKQIPGMSRGTRTCLYENFGFVPQNLNKIF